MMNVTSVLARDEEETQDMREQKAEAMQMQQAMQGAQQAGESMKSVGEGVNAIQGGAAV